MIKYRTDRWGDKIESLEVLKETEKQIVYMNRHGREIREAKSSEWQKWHDTWEEAKDSLLRRAESRVQSLRCQLEKANGELGNIKGMKRP